MLRELTVENLAIIDRARVEFAEGFSALTGETGAGKSLLLDAIGLALGGRADSDLVRAGTPKATVTLLVDLAANPSALARCAELGIDAESGELVIHREVTAEGRSTVRLNGRPAAVGMLRSVGEVLVDLHGQHDHQSLLDRAQQLEFLDSWIGHEARAGVAAVADHFAAAEALRRRLDALRGGRREREHRLDLLRFQIQEIEALDPKPGEVEELQQLVQRLQNQERLLSGAGSALEALQEGEGSVLEILGQSLRELQGLERYDPSLADVTAPLRDALYGLQEGGRGLHAYLDSLDGDPERLEQAATRLDALKRLLRKYGDDEAAVLAHLARSREELALLGGDDSDEATLAEDLARAEATLDASARHLSQLRTEHARQFEAEVLGHLKELAMPRAAFEVAIRPKPVDPTGVDDVEFVFSANAGEPARSLSRVASGGELSRLMLAIKVASAGRAGVPTLVFDEVDTGLSGKAAAITATKLAQLGEHCQVLVISHLPQIAGKAGNHYRIEKVETNGRTVTRVRKLEPEERVEEVARMLAGEAIGDHALANARELLSRPEHPT